MAKPTDVLSASRQIIIVLIVITLYIIWHLKLFVNPKHNMLALAFSIVSLLWLGTISIRFLMGKKRTKNFTFRKPIIKLPNCVKCTIGDKNCKKGDINVWSIIHFVIYTLVGYFIPECYIEIIFISISCELLESGLGHTSKFIADPVVNFLGYSLGSYFSCEK
jgi:hypothetical protein